MTKEEIALYVKSLCERAKKGLPTLALASNDARNQALLAISAQLTAQKDAILAANAKDLANAAENGVPRVMMDRLTLTEARLDAIAGAVKTLTDLSDPLEGSDTWSRPAGITITRQKVPLGLVAIIYEARPNVTADAAALCIKSGNAVVLRGGKEAIETNRAVGAAIKEALATVGISPDVVGLVEVTDRESANALMQMRGLVDVLIPRGGKNLIQNCVNNSRVPVIETGAGNCHVYVDAAADLEKALAVTVNAKCQRPSVCNAAETLLVHRAVAKDLLPTLFAATREWNLEFRGDADTCAILPEAKPATEEDFATEYNDYVLTVKVVDSVDEAIAHVEAYGTRHSEAILPRMPPPRRNSAIWWTPPPSITTPPPASPTARCSASARRSASPRKSSTPEARWAWMRSQLSNIACSARVPCENKCEKLQFLLDKNTHLC